MSGFNFSEYVPTENEARTFSTEPKVTLSARGHISINRKALQDMGLAKDQQKAFLKLYADGQKAIGFVVVSEAGNGVIEINVKPSKGVMFSAKKFFATVKLVVSETKSYELKKLPQEEGKPEMFYIELEIKKPVEKNVPHGNKG